MAQNQMTKTAEQSSADVQAELSKLKSDISSLSASLSDLAAKQTESLNSMARAKVEAVRRTGEETLTEAQKMAANAYKNAESSVKENPATGVAIAAGVGFLVGLFAGRR